MLRGWWMLRDDPRLARRWARTLPHVNDTLLLMAGVTLAVWSGQYPPASAWLTAKLSALLGYILLGALALRPGRPKALRVAAWALALLVFGYMVQVATSKQPWGWF